jgi:putative lipase involved disintegration of autophagic bodies
MSGHTRRDDMSADEQGYNGWKNHETWAVGMFLDGNYDGPGVYYGTVETVRVQLEDVQHPTSEYWSVEQSERFGVADALKDYVEEMTNPHMVDDDHPVQLEGLVADLFTAALQDVDWHELADAWITSARETSRVDWSRG